MYYLNTGDRLVREKGYFFSKHHALYAGRNEEGIEIVAENQIYFGVRFITLTQFLQEGKLVRVERFEGKLSERQVILQRIYQLIGAPYHLIDFNCEHFCNYVLFGKKKSNQIRNAGILIGLSVLGLASRSSQNRKKRSKRRA